MKKYIEPDGTIVWLNEEFKGPSLEFFYKGIKREELPSYVRVALEY